MNKPDSSTTRLGEYIASVLPWAHGHQLKAITTFVAQLLNKQTGCQAHLARGLGNQEAACKRLSRLLHNPRLDPKDLAEAVLWQAVSQLPQRGAVRLAIDWTTEADQHLLVVSLIVGRRAVPLYWRAYHSSVLKGRMQRYELAVVRRAISSLQRAISSLQRAMGRQGQRRLIVTADRGFADGALFDLLNELQVAFIIRVKGSTKVCYQGRWSKLNRLRFGGNTRRTNLGCLAYCESCPQRLWVTMSRQRDRQAQWSIWYLVSNRAQRAQRTTWEYARRFGCEEGFRDAKWWLGFKEARIQAIQAWSRLFALFALTLLVVISLGVKLLVRPGRHAWPLLRRVLSRRRNRGELSLVSTISA